MEGLCGLRSVSRTTPRSRRTFPRLRPTASEPREERTPPYIDMGEVHTCATHQIPHLGIKGDRHDGHDCVGAFL